MFQLKICLSYFNSCFLESRRNFLSFHIMLDANIIKVIKVANYNHLQCQHKLYIFQRINYFPLVKAFPFLSTVKFLKVLLNTVFESVRRSQKLHSQLWHFFSLKAHSFSSDSLGYILPTHASPSLQQGKSACAQFSVLQISLKPLS